MPDPTIRRLVALRQRFKRLHREGMAALQKQNLGMFARVVAEERELFDRHAHLMQEDFGGTRKKS